MPANPNVFLNRELSWLVFNRRVLEEALDPSLPLLERLKFLAITASNLDEFFMVRVGGLQQLVEQGRQKPDFSGLTPSAQLKEMGRLARQMTDDQYACLRDLETRLADAGIRRARTEELTPGQDTYIERLFMNEIMPVVSPIALTPDRPFPSSPGSESISSSASGRTPRRKKKVEVAIVTLPKGLARFITLPIENGYHFVLLEDVVDAVHRQPLPGSSHPRVRRPSASPGTPTWPSARTRPPTSWRK